MGEQYPIQSGEERLAEFDALGGQAEAAARAHLEAPGTVPDGTLEDIKAAQSDVSTRAAEGRITAVDAQGRPISVFQEQRPSHLREEGVDHPLDTVVRRFEKGETIADARFPYRTTEGDVAASNEVYRDHKAA